MKKTQGKRGPDRAPRKFNPAQLANLHPRKPGTGLKTGAAKAFYVRATESVIQWFDGMTAEERGRFIAHARTNNCSPKVSDSATVTTEQ